VVAIAVAGFPMGVHPAGLGPVRTIGERTVQLVPKLEELDHFDTTRQNGSGQPEWPPEILETSV
jgi:hypothetical protein